MLSNQVRMLRDKRGWTMQELADAAGVAVSVVWKIEHDVTVRRDSLEKVASALDAELEIALRSDELTPPEPEPDPGNAEGVAA